MWTINNQYHSIYQFELIAIILVFLPKFNAIAYRRTELWYKIWIGPFFAHPCMLPYSVKKNNWRITFTRIIKLYAIALKLPTVYFLPAVKIFFLHSFYEKFNFQCFVSMFVLFRFCFSWLTLKSFHNLFENVHIFCSNNIFIFSGTLCILPGFPK